MTHTSPAGVFGDETRLQGVGLGADTGVCEKQTWSKHQQLDGNTEHRSRVQKAEAAFGGGVEGDLRPETEAFSSKIAGAQRQ